MDTKKEYVETTKQNNYSYLLIALVWTIQKAKLLTISKSVYIGWGLKTSYDI